jgi:RNA recognition motif-containing protein
MQIYVGSLNFGTTENTLRDLFGAYGEIKSVKIIIDRDSGRSKGFGFIEMENSEEARDAIANLNGYELEGRNLRVNEANKK